MSAAESDGSQSKGDSVGRADGKALIPIFITAYNNLSHVRNMIEQLRARGMLDRVTVWDNASSDRRLHAYYDTCGAQVIRSPVNLGHNWWHDRPDVTSLTFVLTDPDLELSPSMPADWIEQLHALSLEYNAARVGLALDLSDAELMIDYGITRPDGGNNVSYERQFWRQRIPHPRYEMYRAPIDTTLHLHRRTPTRIGAFGDFFGRRGIDNIRVAGAFVCKHLPWYDPVRYRARYGAEMASPDDEETRHYTRMNKTSTVLGVASSCGQRVTVNGVSVFVRKNAYWSSSADPWTVDVAVERPRVFVLGCAALHVPIAVLLRVASLPSAATDDERAVICYDPDVQVLADIDFCARSNGLGDLLRTTWDAAEARAMLDGERGSPQCVGSREALGDAPASREA